jgi:hypothetical protein
MLKAIDYTCGGTTTERKLIKFKLDTTNGEVSQTEIWEGMIDIDSGMFLVNDKLKKTIVRDENEIREHIPGIKKKLEIENGINSVKFKF